VDLGRASGLWDPVKDFSVYVVMERSLTAHTVISIRLYTDP